MTRGTFPCPGGGCARHAGSRSEMECDMKLKPAISFTFTLLAISAPLFAHHGGAVYDNAKTIALKGTIASFEWTSPHSQIHLDVPDEKGNLVHWNFECQPPSILIHAGWTKSSLKPGDRVTIVARPVRNGAPIGVVSQVVLANGQELTPTEK
jgi:hypothetical protein